MWLALSWPQIRTVSANVPHSIIGKILVEIFQGCTVLCDAAHAIGNIPVELHKWDVDCAVWCSYKVLNSLRISITAF